MKPPRSAYAIMPTPEEAVQLEDILRKDPTLNVIRDGCEVTWWGENAGDYYKILANGKRAVIIPSDTIGEA